MAIKKPGLGMTPLLLLVHRIPYPPNKGDKVRSFNLLKTLAKHYDLYLVAFVDDDNDWQYENKLDQYCKKFKLFPLNKISAKLRSFKGLLTGEALSLPYYRDARVQRWVDQTVKKYAIQHALVFSSPMAQYVENVQPTLKKRIADFVDIDSDKWLQYSNGCRFPMKWIYRREAKTLLKFEKKIAIDFDSTLFVSENERDDFNKYLPENASKHDFYNNGVDYEFFNPALNLSNPYDNITEVIAFTGAMDYWANADAVQWFALNVFSEIKKSRPMAYFYIVGSNPSREVMALEKLKGVVVTGRVEDIRSYIKYANLIVAPMRIARGVQNKILEAMAMEKSVVATSLALEGIAQCDEYQPQCADSPAEFTKCCLSMLKVNVNVPAARRCIEEHYNWDANLQKVVNLLRDEEKS